MRKRFFLFVAQHCVIIAGCVILALPFGWLVLTSLKSDHEMFTQFWPEIPDGVKESPYAAPPRRGLSREERQRVLALARELDPERTTALAGDAFAQSLASALVETAERRGARVEDLTEADVARVFDTVYRAVRISEVFVWDHEFTQERVPESPNAWRVTGGQARLVEASFSRTPAQRLAYDFSDGEPVHVRLDFDAPVDADAFHRIAVGVRGDGSWYAVNAEVVVEGQRWVSERPWMLSSVRWLDMTWQIPSRQDDTPGYKEYIALTPAGSVDTTGTYVELHFEPASPLAVAVRKLTANYTDVFRRIPFWKYAFNSLLLVVLNIMGALIACPLVAYAFARWQWPGRDVLFVLILATMMLPAHVTMIPVFLVYEKLGWHDSLKPLFIGSFFGSAFFIFLLRQFMKSIPKDLERAARIDGCGYFGVYRHVILPLIKPSLAAIAIFQFQASWNAFLGPLIYLNSQDLYPLALGLFEFKEKYSVAYGMLMSTSFLMTLPVILVFFFAQRYFIQGVTLTGLKG